MSNHMMYEDVRDDTFDPAIPVNERMDALRAEVSELREEIRKLNNTLAPIDPIIAGLPDLMKKVGPLLEGLRTSPVLKMLGVKLP